MQPLTQKYTIIQLLEDIPEGTQYSSSSWPLHTTVADAFAIDWDVPTLVAKKLTALLEKQPRITTTAADDTYLGSEGQTQVTLLEKNEASVKLHYDVVALLEQGGVKFNNPQFTKEGFLPHSTVQPHTRLNKGDKVTYDALSLIDMFPDEDASQRKVLKTIRFSGK